MMIKLMLCVEGTSEELKETRSLAQAAKDEADKAIAVATAAVAEVTTIKQDIDIIKQNSIQEKDLRQAVRDVVAEAWTVEEAGGKRGKCGRFKEHVVPIRRERAG